MRPAGCNVKYSTRCNIGTVTVCSNDDHFWAL